MNPFIFYDSLVGVKTFKCNLTSVSSYFVLFNHYFKLPNCIVCHSAVYIDKIA